MSNHRVRYPFVLSIIVIVFLQLLNCFLSQPMSFLLSLQWVPHFPGRGRVSDWLRGVWLPGEFKARQGAEQAQSPRFALGLNRLPRAGEGRGQHSFLGPSVWPELMVCLDGSGTAAIRVGNRTRNWARGMPFGYCRKTIYSNLHVTAPEVTLSGTCKEK